MIELTNLDRVLFPEAGFTKAQLVEYYRLAGPALVKHLAGRATTLVRFPEGVHKKGWYQSNCRGQPGFMRTADVTGPSGKRVVYCVFDTVEAVIWAANTGAIEFHPFLARADDPDRPHALVFDLDPGAPAGLRECSAVAVRLRDRLAPLWCFPKTSGAKGLHVYVPLNGTHTFSETKEFARRLAHALAEESPDLVTDQPLKAKRAGKVFIDWGQNDANRSTVAPWSLRATALPGASVPVSWDEVAAGKPLWFSAESALQRLSAGDSFAPVLTVVQRLPEH